MLKYEVNVRETVWYNFTVEAWTEEQAEEKARNIWCNDGEETVDHAQWLRWRQSVEVDGEVDDFFLTKSEEEE